MAGKGQRVIACAMLELAENDFAKRHEFTAETCPSEDLVLLGLVALQDPPKPGSYVQCIPHTHNVLKDHICYKLYVCTSSTVRNACVSIHPYRHYRTTMLVIAYSGLSCCYYKDCV
jgi:hypothetical protein